MSKGMISLPDGRCATESEALSALAQEARRRNISYGLLVDKTTRQERVEIIRAYCLEKRKKGRKRVNGY